MSKRGYITRYNLILKKLKAKPYSTLEELQGFVERQFEYLQDQDDSLVIGFSKRTFQRDIREIRNNFGVEIEYSRKDKGYFISSGEMDTMNFQRRMEAFDVFNSLKLAEDLVPFVQLENRRPQGTENLYGLLHAIKNRFQIGFMYHKFWDEEGGQRTADPLALKEFRNRWYLMARDHKDRIIKSFALDRLSQLDISNQKFEFPKNYNIEESYRYCFGIVSPNGQEPQEIVLSFTRHQGKYLKTLPLHSTQQVLVDNNRELQISLKLCITFDLVMELLSFGDNMKVLQPKSLADEIKAAHQKAFEQYRNE
jgi:predicted DNA-binding transcriptional regulator YafY